MLQFRDIPVNYPIGGGLYISSMTGSAGDRTVQVAGANLIYFRPNITSSNIPNPTRPGVVSFWCLGF